MTKKYLFNWSMWIGLMCGLYALIYAYTPLAAYGFVWMSFATLPVYFMAGVKTEEFFNFTASLIVGILWGIVYIASITFLIKMGLSGIIANAIGVGVVVAIHCAVHLIFTSNSKTYLNILPIMFTSVSMCFSQGGENLIPIGFSVFGGVVLGLTCGIGKLFLTEDGSWTLPSGEMLAGILKTKNTEA